MSDEENEMSQTTTNIDFVKEKKQRTPAQIEATNKALDALANARRVKAEAKKNEGQVIAKRTTTTTKIVKPKISSSSKPKPVPEPVVKVEKPKPVPSYKEEFSAFRDEIKGMLVENQKKPKRKVVVEESESEPEEEVVIRKKIVKKNNLPPEAPVSQSQDNRHLLEQIFFRHH